MNSYTIRALMDASLFCSQPCILTTFNLDSSDTGRLYQHEQVTREFVTTQFSEIGIELNLDNAISEPALPFSIFLIKCIAVEMMMQLDLDCGPVTC